LATLITLDARELLKKQVARSKTASGKLRVSVESCASLCSKNEKANIMAAPTVNTISALNDEKEAASQVERPSLSSFTRIKR
jgi:hypothetical protein